MLKNQNGVATLELIAVMLITGFIGLGTAVATVQVVNQGTYNSDYNTARRHTMNTIHWISRDAQMAQELELAAEPDPDGFPLTLSWVEWEGDQITVTYSIVDGEMIRSHSGDGDLVVARHINSDEDMTNCDYENWVFNFRITATIGGYPEEVSETRDGKISPRTA